MTTSVIIVAAEQPARDRLRRLLSTESDVRIVAESESAAEAVTTIAQHRPDVVFLDIDLPDRSGRQVIDAIPPSARPVFVLVTASEVHAVDAFPADALDYLRKPLDTTRFEATMRRVRERVGVTIPNAPLADTPLNGYLERLAVKMNGGIAFVQVSDIDFIEAAANYVRVHCGAESYLIRQTLGDLFAQLDPARFARIHRSTIVQLDRIKVILPKFSGDAVVILCSGGKVRLSRSYRSAVGLGIQKKH